MTRQQFLPRLDYLNLVHGVTLRAISTFSDADLAFRPAQGMRSPRELIFHIYSQERAMAVGAGQGRISVEDAGSSNPEDGPGAAECATLVTVEEARAFAAACHRMADETYRSMSDEQLSRPVESPFGAHPAWRLFAFTYDEHWHHRGQLYTYLRLLGKNPPMLYDY
jgi:uncharacterized damage-inducible protein DinB